VHYYDLVLTFNACLSVACVHRDLILRLPGKGAIIARIFSSLLGPHGMNVASSHRLYHHRRLVRCVPLLVTPLLLLTMR